MNQVIQDGVLGRDPEVRYTQTGIAVANMSVAVNDFNRKTKEEKTYWVRLVAWGTVAEMAGEHLKKGSKVFYVGKYTDREWQTKEGETKKSVEIVVSYLVPVASRKKSEGHQYEEDKAGNVPDDDIPF